MGLLTAVAGRYSATYNKPGDSARSLGITREGFTIGARIKNEVVDRTDAYGQGTVVETFYQGQTVNISAIFHEQIAGVLNAVSPYGAWAGTGAVQWSLGTIGTQGSDLAGILVLTATAGTPAATSPATLTATYALQMEDVDVDLLFGPQHRVFPWRARLFPFLSTNVKFFTST
jgi:hypothetical protein